jgi:signal transduction histidine kinase
MIRRISTKWVLTVLAAVVLPFVGFAWYVNTQMSGRIWAVVQYYLLSIAGDLRDRIDNELRERKLDIEVWAEDPVAEWALGDYGGDEVYFHSMLQNGFDRFMEKSGLYDLLIAVDAQGSMVVASVRGPNGDRFPADVTAALRARRFEHEPWFEEALQGRTVLVDVHRSDLVPPKNPMAGKHPENYHLGIAAPVRDAGQKVVGVVYALINWSHFQYGLLRPNKPGGFEGTIARDIYASSYAWLWRDDCDTIIGHPSRDLYEQRVSEDVGLPQLVAAARAAPSGMYPEYTFRGVRKNAAFAHTAGRDKGGLGWVVGIGIDNADIYATVDDLRHVLLVATLSVLGIVVLGTVLIARRTTRPILALQRQTQRVAAGDLDTQIEVASDDELGDLARAFNLMTRELAESRSRLIKAEKDAAWREMARQVAHEIKNPLTPIALSIDLLRRARDEKSPEFDRIFARTTDMMQRQVESMRVIAADFHAFAGAHKPVLEKVEVGPLVDEVLALDAAWAAELGVTMRREGAGGRAYADRGELRRVLINVVSNALEASPEGGELVVAVDPIAGAAGPAIRIEVRDRGVGLSEEAQGRLFEPYFTTRTHGTGLGLAIARRLVEEMNGTIELEPRPGGGTVARIVLPAHGGGAAA